MHGTSNDRRALEREALRNVINQWNANRLDLFELSEPNEDLEFHGVMRFYFQDSGQKVATKCIRVASDATVKDVIGTLVEKFRPDMRMLSVPQYALFELHEGCPERKMEPDEKPLLVQLNWHVDDREGRFLLKNVDDKTVNSMTSMDSNASFRRKLSKREKKQLKKQEKLSRMKSENGDLNDDGVTEKLYNELPETSFTRSISNPEAVMRRRRQQKLEKKLQQFRSKDGGPDTGGTLKIYGEALCKDVPYKTLLLSIRDCAGTVIREMLDKYGLTKTDPSQWCLVQVTQQPGCPDTEYVLDDDECPLSILMTAPNTGSIMFHVRRRPADCAPRKRKKKPLSASARDLRNESAAVLIELGPDGSAPIPGDTNRTIRLTGDVLEVGSANGIGLQLYGPHIQPRHCVINTGLDGITSITPCHADALTYVNGQRLQHTTVLQHGNLIKFGHSNTYRFLDPAQEERGRSSYDNGRMYDSRSPRALSPTETSRDNIETTFDLDGNVETVSTASGARDDNRSLGSSSENRLSGYVDRYNPSTSTRSTCGQDPILPAVLEFPEEPQEQFLARVITHLDVTTPTFRLAPAYTLYLCARYRASTHYRPELTPTERAHKLTVLLQRAAALVRHTVQDRSTESTSQAFWLANASEILHFLKSDRHVSAFSLQAQDTLADAVQLAFKNLVACLTDELNTAMGYLMSASGDDHPREVINILSASMNLLRKCRVNAALTIQLFSQLFHWISAKALTTVISNSNLCTRAFGSKLYNRLRNLQAWAESQGLELAAECHLAKIVQCAHLLQAPKYAPEDLANLSAVCFKLNSLQLGALLMQYKAEPGEQLAPPSLLEQAAKAAESVADELLRAEGRAVALYDDPSLPCHLLLPDDGYSCDVVHGVPPGLADFLQPLQASGLCRLAAQPTSSGQWTVYMNTANRPASAMSTTQPEVHIIRLHKAGGGMGLSIVAAKGAGQERLGIYIKSVVPGGAADRDGRLAAGDQLLSVDGQSLLGITQEKAAEFLQRTGSVVALEVAKAGAVYHGLATLLQQPSPQPHRGPRRMSERDLPSRIDSEQRSAIPSSKSVPALHQIHSPTSPDHPNPPSTSSSSSRQVGSEVYPGGSNGSSYGPGGSRTMSTTNIERNGPPMVPALRSSRSTHNLHQQQDAGFYQNLSIYRNKVPSPQQLGDRTSALRSSQNSLHSSVITNNSQRPSSAYYPPNSANNAAARPNNLHQSIPNIPNLKSSPSTTRLHNSDDIHQSVTNLKSVADARTGGSYPNVQQYGQQNYYPQYMRPQQQQQQNSYPSHEDLKVGYQHSYGGPSQPYPSPNQGSSMNYNNNVQQPLHINPNSRQDDRQEVRYNNVGGGLLREDVFRQSQNSRHDEIMRYPSQNNIRISEAHIQNNDLSRHNEMRTSKSEDALRHLAQSDMLRYASSGNIRDNARMEVTQPGRLLDQQPRIGNDDRHLRGAAKLAEMSEEVRRRQNRLQHGQQPPGRDYYQQQQYYNHVMSHNTQSMQNLSLGSQQMPYNQQTNQYSQNMISPTYKVSSVPSKPIKKEDQGPPDLPPVSTHPLYSASTQDPPKMAYYPSTNTLSNKVPRDPWTREEQERQQEARREAARQWQEQQIRELSALPYRTPQQEEQLRVLKLEKEFQRRALEAAEEDGDDDTEKESLTPVPQPVSSQTVISTLNATTVSSKHEPSQIPPTSILKPGGSTNTHHSQNQQTQSYNQPQHNQIQVAHSQNHISPNQNQMQHSQAQIQHSQSQIQHSQSHMQHSQTQMQHNQPQMQQNQNQMQYSQPNVSQQQQHHVQSQQSQASPTESSGIPPPPAPPERGSSFAVMSMRVKESKRVSFNDAGQQQQQQNSQAQQQHPAPPSSLHLDESVREDPNSFIRQAESMLASPVTPTDASPSGTSMATPGVIGAQEVYRDPRARRLAEQAQKKDQMQNVPEKLSFKEKMKMFAMETGEAETPKDKSKISRAQRDIDTLGSPPQSSGMVH